MLEVILYGPVTWPTSEDPPCLSSISTKDGGCYYTSHGACLFKSRKRLRHPFVGICVKHTRVRPVHVERTASTGAMKDGKAIHTDGRRGLYRG